MDSGTDNEIAFPSAKNSLYEYGIHMPLAIRGPAGSPDEKSAHGWIFGDIDQSPTNDYLLEHQDEKSTHHYF